MMHHTDSAAHSDTVLAFAIGMAAGAAVALMFAPATGRDTRAFLASKSRGLAEKGRELVDQGRTAVRDTRDTITRRVNDAVDQGRRGYREALHRGQAAAHEAVDDMANLARVEE